VVTTYPFDPIRLKLRRAQHYIGLLNEVRVAFFQSEFYRFGTKIDRKNRLLIYVAKVKEPPPEIALLIGDAAHNLRCVLDHLAFVFAPGSPNTVQFPICSTRKAFKNSNNRLKGASTRAMAIFKQLQPYHCRTWPDTRLLGYLQEISNCDKHRKLLIAAAVLQTVKFTALHPGIKILNQEIFRRTLKPDAVVARLTIEGGARGREVHMEAEPALFPVFDERMPEKLRYVPILILADIAHFIENEVIPRFEHRFFHSAAIYRRGM
jgi:hypothetical protein